MIRYILPLLLPLAACATTVGSDLAAAPQAPRAPFTSERIGVTVTGQGPDVILIHGLSSSPDVWDTTVRAVPGYRYHLVHVAGMGGRPPGANAQGPVVAPVAEEIARYIREAGLQRPAIVGHSLGGAWAMLVAARHPELVGRLMVVDMLPFMGAMFGGPRATPESVRPIAEQFRQGMLASTGPQRETMAADHRHDGAHREPAPGGDQALAGQRPNSLRPGHVRPHHHQFAAGAQEHPGAADGAVGAPAQCAGHRGADGRLLQGRLRQRTARPHRPGAERIPLRHVG